MAWTPGLALEVHAIDKKLPGQRLAGTGAIFSVPIRGARSAGTERGFAQNSVSSGPFTPLRNSCTIPTPRLKSGSVGVRTESRM